MNTSQLQTTSTTTDAAEAIASLTVASEFLQCAIRALAWGAAVDSAEARDPVLWAQEKIAEAVASDCDTL